MKFADPTIYKCPSCKKKMKMTTYSSYTTRGGSLYSDGINSGSSGFTPDLAKCPHCAAVFFRSKIKNKKTMKFSLASNIEKIEIPKRIDLIKALETGIAKDWKEEKQIREDLWRNFNNTYRYSYSRLSERLLNIYLENCKSLLTLTKKSLKLPAKLPADETKKIDNEDYNDDYVNTLIQTAELNRNLGNFDECIKILENLETEKSNSNENQKWSWLTKQFFGECKRENTVLFKLLSRNEMNMENSQVEFNKRNNYTINSDLSSAESDINKIEINYDDDLDNI